VSATDSLSLPESPLDCPYGEMARFQLRGSIAVEAGKKTNWETPLTKETLNSVYAYLTGEYVIPKRALHNPDHPAFRPRQYILSTVVFEAAIGEPQDEWSPVGGSQPTELRRDELQTLREEMDSRGNQMIPDGSY